MGTILKPRERDLSTGEVATICKVSPRTVTLWIDSGRLQGYRVSGRGRSDRGVRRVSRKTLRRFLEDHGLPADGLIDESSAKVLLIGAEPTFEAAMKAAAAETEDFLLQTTSSCFEAGVALAEFRPACVVIDMAIGRIEAAQIIQAIRQDGDSRETILIAMAYGEDVSTLGFDQVLRKPIGPVHLIARIQNLMS